jgi:hypothetical protein
MGNWPTVSTRDAVLALTKTFTTRQFGKTWVEDQSGKYFLFHNGMQLQTGDYYCHHKIINPVFPTIHNLDRKKFNAKLKQFKNYYNYMLGLAKVDAWRGQDVVRQGEALDILTNNENYRGGMFEPEPEAAFALSKAIMGTEYGGSKGYWVFFVKHYNPRFDPQQLENAVTKALKRAVIHAHKDELLTKQTVTTGRAVKDPYGWAWE